MVGTEDGVGLIYFLAEKLQCLVTGQPRLKNSQRFHLDTPLRASLHRSCADEDLLRIPLSARVCAGWRSLRTEITERDW